MEKTKIGIIFGGKSTEHNVSVVSGTAIIENLNKEKYEIYPIYIDRIGNWFETNKPKKILKFGEELETNKKIENICEYLKKLDVIFPILHGIGGEDGSIQGLFELLNIPYIGPKILSSSICMDKAYTKIIFEKAGILQAKYIYIKKNKSKYIYVENDFEEKEYNIDEISQKISKKIKFPMFIKPSNSGSSVGIKKAKNIEELKEFIEYASQFDKKILIEENIVGKEIECAVLGNEEIETSILGEVVPADEFYSFDAKYLNKESNTIMPARLSKEISQKIQNLAIRAYKATDCKGLARVDFFVREEEGKIYINEINTLPGFTEISMYPKLWQKTGLSFQELLDKLIDLAFIN